MLCQVKVKKMLFKYWICRHCVLFSGVPTLFLRIADVLLQMLSDNLWLLLLQGVDVNSRTSEYQAIAGNVGVAQSHQRAVISNSATAKTTTGSALAYNIANAAVSQQNSATASSDATTTTGQAAGVWGCSLQCLNLVVVLLSASVSLTKFA